MDVFIQGKGSIRLGQNDFVGQGGEGAVYARGKVAYKIYNDPARMLPVGKINELAALTDPRIIRPQDVLLDKDHRPIGYTMPRVKDGVPLCRLFTRSFRERQGLSLTAMVSLVRRFQDGVAHVHARGMLVVDLNEMNFLLDAGFQDVLFIDVDSYQTPSFPATALMDSVRDRHSHGFSPLTDWFSFAVVTFQMLVGIHPYRGKHPTLADLDQRMQANVSVFNPQVTLPKVCYPFDVIPQAYRDWYRAVFEEGKRLPPPDGLRPVVAFVPAVQQIAVGGKVRTQVVARFPAEILYPVQIGGAAGAVTVDGLFLNGRRHPVGRDVRIGFTPRMNRPVAAWVEGGRLSLFDVLAGKALSADLEAEALTGYDGRLYVKRGDGLYEVEWIELPSGLRAALRQVGNAMENATQLFEGVAVQSLLGGCYASLFPAAGVCYPVRLKELDGFRVVDGKFERNVLMLVGVRNGQYHRFVFRFDSAFTGYDVRETANVAYAGLNFTVLENGVCLHLNENDELELFSHRKGAPELKVVTDPALEGVRLFRNGAQAVLAKGDTLYSATMTPGT